MSIYGANKQDRSIIVTACGSPYASYGQSLRIDFESQAMRDGFIEHLKEIDPKLLESEYYYEKKPIYLEGTNSIMLPCSTYTGDYTVHKVYFKNLKVANEFSKLILSKPTSVYNVDFDTNSNGRNYSQGQKIPLTPELAALADRYAEEKSRTIGVELGDRVLTLIFESQTMRDAFVKKLKEVDPYALQVNNINLVRTNGISIPYSYKIKDSDTDFTNNDITYFLDFTTKKVAQEFSKLIYSRDANHQRLRIDDDVFKGPIVVSKALAKLTKEHSTIPQPSAPVLNSPAPVPVPSLTQFLFPQAPQPSAATPKPAPQTAPYLPSFSSQQPARPAAAKEPQGRVTLFKTDSNDLAIRFASESLRDQFIGYVFADNGTLVKTMPGKDNILYIPSTLIANKLLITKFSNNEQKTKFYQALGLDADKHDAILNDAEPTIYFQGSILEDGNNIKSDVSQEFVEYVLLGSLTAKLK
ncbi:MAG: hypothetical protein JSR17_10295 [Proteobacteria bacterium]|nr:hypothetical protein [Pseudomonadota bacterium]